jgi:hypothetical protein
MIQKFDIKEHKGGEDGCASCLSPFDKNIVKPENKYSSLKGCQMKGGDAYEVTEKNLRT